MKSGIKEICLLILICCAYQIMQAESRILLDQRTLNIRRSGKAVLSVNRKVLVADKKGESLGQVVLHEHQYSKVKAIKGSISNLAGRRLAKLDQNKIKEWHGNPSEKLYGDDHFYFFNLSHHQKPYIINYSYKKKIASLYFFKEWFPQKSFAVDKAVLQIRYRRKPCLRFHSTGDMPAPVKTQQGKTWTWTLSDIPKLENEYRMPPECNYQLGLQLAPRNFKLEGINGNYNSWAEYGNFYAQLAKQQYRLTDDAIQSLSLSPESTPEKIVQTVYEFIQHNTHYVGVEEGIHGLKPHCAQTVFENKYGDCKDLTTLMIAMLQKLGLPAYPAMLKVRDLGVMDTSFPLDQFNHIICCVPLDKDTLWVDCVSDVATVHDLPATDEGCNVLVINDGHGQVARTPLSSALDNRVDFNAQVEIDNLGHAHVTGTITQYGNSDHWLKNRLRSRNDKQQRKLLLKWLSEYSPGIKLGRFNYEKLDKNGQPTRIKFSCRAKQYANLSMNRLFINPAFYHRTRFSAEEPEKREHPVFYLYPFTIKDHIVYQLPPNYTPEAIPDSLSIEHSFGTYRFAIRREGNSFIYERKYQINDRMIPVDDYTVYYEFRQAAERADKNQLVFKKQ